MVASLRESARREYRPLSREIERIVVRHLSETKNGASE